MTTSTPAPTPAQRPILLLTGPTAIGKTAVAVEFALRNNCELISADSMQVYRGLEIGTAQPSSAELRGVPLHLSGCVDPRETFNARKYVEASDAARAEIISRGRTPLFVGGTGMWLRAIRWGLFEPGDDIDTSQAGEVRRELESRIAAQGSAALHAELGRLDPESAARIHPNDPVRIVRALETHRLLGRPISELRREWETPSPRFPHRLVILETSRADLVDRINQRVDEMLRAGWIEETRRLLDAGTPPGAHCFKALGYPEIIAHLRGSMTYEKMVETIKARTRQFARRQMTWFRKERDAIWLPISAENAGRIARNIENLLAA